MRYIISQGLLRPLLEVEIDGVPPCLFCGEPVERASMDGPLVCGACDCGNNRDGSRWTDEQARERYAHRRSMIVTYREQMIDRQVREAKDLIAKMTHPCFAQESEAAAFAELAWKLLPELIGRDALRGEEVAKWATASGTARDQFEALLREVAELRVEVARYQPQTITIGNLTQFSGAAGQLRASLRAAIEKLPLESVRELRALSADPRRSCGGANQADYEHSALTTLLATLPDLLGVYEEVARLVKGEL